MDCLLRVFSGCVVCQGILDGWTVSGVRDSLAVCKGYLTVDCLSGILDDLTFYQGYLTVELSPECLIVGASIIDS